MKESQKLWHFRARKKVKKHDVGKFGIPLDPEVCKEWLVREDGALAYKLQSQEINDFYKGNRYRNEVVRTDFPTALEEQIKEKNNAEKQTECYKKYLSEQEEHDKQVALEIADRIEKDHLEQRQREFEESEEITDNLQNIYRKRDFSQIHHSQKVDLPLYFNTSSSHSEDIHPSIDHHQSNYLQKSTHNYLNDTNQALQVSTNVLSINTNISRCKRHTGPSLPVDNITQCMEPTVSFIFDSSIKQTRQKNHSSKNKCSPLSDIDGDGKIKNNFNFLKLSESKFDQLLESNSCKSYQLGNEHRDDIDLDPDLKGMGLPMEEIKEVNEKIKQEKKDEELAIKLQEMEKLNGLTLEDRDRLLAIEAQDKELAKMLQEREKGKAKGTREKARLKKHQYQKEPLVIHNGPLLPLPQKFSELPLSSKLEAKGQKDLYAYCNPKDLISHQRMQDERSRTNNTHPSENADNSNDDDIYSLPIDNCVPNSLPSINQSTVSAATQGRIRPGQYSLFDIQTESHESLRLNNSISGYYEPNSGPVLPYMPIQGTRRSNSNDERKKKSKDKCIHQ